MSIFLGRQCAFVFPIYVRKYQKYTIDRWIVVYTVCASAVISPLRQWLDSYAKTRLKMWHTFKHFIHMQYFCCRLILLSPLYTELPLVCCTNPDNVHCFGTIFPNLNFVSASICATRPAHIQSDQYRSCSTVNNVTTRCGCCSRHSSRWGPGDGGQPKTALWLWVHELTWYLYISADEWRQNNADLSYSRTVSWMVSSLFSASCSWRPLDWRIRHSHLASTLFHSLVPWWRPRRIRPQITRLCQLENSAMETWPIYKNSIIPDWFEKMAWYKILIHVLIV